MRLNHRCNPQIAECAASSIDSPEANHRRIRRALDAFVGVGEQRLNAWVDPRRSRGTRWPGPDPLDAATRTATLNASWTPGNASRPSSNRYSRAWVVRSSSASMAAISWDWTRPRRWSANAAANRTAGTRSVVFELVDRADGRAVADPSDAFGRGPPHAGAPVGQMRLEVGQIVGRADARERQRQPIHVAVARASDQIAHTRKRAILAHEAERLDGKQPHGLARVVDRRRAADRPASRWRSRPSTRAVAARITGS